MGFAASAMAQPVPQLEINFVSATLPLSPLLTVVIGVAVERRDLTFGASARR